MLRLLICFLRGMLPQCEFLPNFLGLLLSVRFGFLIKIEVVDLNVFASHEMLLLPLDIVLC